MYMDNERDTERRGTLPVGAAIKSLRKARRMTAAQVGERRGVKEQTVYKFEGDTGNPAIGTVESYINALSITPTQFVEALAESIRARLAMKGILEDGD